MVAPAYAEQRRCLAKSIGLGPKKASDVVTSAEAVVKGAARKHLGGEARPARKPLYGRPTRRAPYRWAACGRGGDERRSLPSGTTADTRAAASRRIERIRQLEMVEIGFTQFNPVTAHILVCGSFPRDRFGGGAQLVGRRTFVQERDERPHLRRRRILRIGIARVPPGRGRRGTGQAVRVCGPTSWP